MSSPSSPTRETTSGQRTAEIIQRRLREIGILVKIRTVEWAAFVKEFIEKGRFEAVLLGWNTGLDPDQYDIWHSSKTKPGELNFTHYKNPEVDALLDEGRHTFDREKRRRAYFKLPGDPGRGPALHLPLCPRRPARHLQALPGHQTGPRRASTTTSSSGTSPKGEQKYTMSPY